MSKVFLSHDRSICMNSGKHCMNCSDLKLKWKTWWTNLKVTASYPDLLLVFLTLITCLLQFILHYHQLMQPVYLILHFKLYRKRRIVYIWANQSTSFAHPNYVLFYFCLHLIYLLCTTGAAVCFYAPYYVWRYFNKWSNQHYTGQERFYLGRHL